MLKRTFGAALAAVLVSSASHARNVVSMATLTGTCKRLIIAPKTDASQQCVGKLINVNYDDGRSGFYFVAGDVAAITFTGIGSAQVKLNEDEVVQPVDGIIFTLIGMGTKPNFSPAVGSCRFTNPEKGRPSLVNCEATTKDGRFIANFVSDGRPPR
jgi:hypothetical protein